MVFRACFGRPCMFWLSVSRGPVERVGSLDSSGFVPRCYLGQLYKATVASPGNEVRGNNTNFFLLPCPGFFLVPRLF